MDSILLHHDSNHDEFSFPAALSPRIAEVPLALPYPHRGYRLLIGQADTDRQGGRGRGPALRGRALSESALLHWLRAEVPWHVKGS